MALCEKLTVINSASIGALLKCAAEHAEDEGALPMLLAIAFEYVLLLSPATPTEVEFLRASTLAEARKQAASFRAIVKKEGGI